MVTETGNLQITSRAPTRIDLAGGTVDIWPIYLFLKNPTTLNLGISLFAETQLEENDSGKIQLKSADQGDELIFGWDELNSVTAGPSLVLHLKFLRHFAKEKTLSGRLNRSKGLKLSTSAKSPAGAGLGGSSTLSISMIGALATWSRGSVDPLRDGERLIEIARDTETTVIQVPAGLQDYYGAMFGGLQSLRWRVGVHERTWHSEETLTQLKDRLLLFYSGQSRNSGINNWALFKAFIDQQGKVRDQFASIAEATQRAEQCLIARDWTGVGQAIAAEWEVRRTLAPGISTPEMDHAFDTARALGASAGKICGAGGGGCFFVYLPENNPALKNKIQAEIEKQGIRPLPFEAVPRGLEVQVKRA